MSGYIVQEKDMGEWTRICEAFAEKMKAKLLFVNETSCGLEFPGGKFWHCNVDDMVEYLQEN